ncbi:ribonuclease P protein component [Luteimonas salinilitoris]|uniref:Ribonuclease P protein component n=1 Tax=Luteimonas salinilitoris TaxID=3237697 RepID=A0ABV4HN00_9GAMM
MTAGFPKQARVRARADFDRVFKHARRTASPLMALHWLDDASPPRLGLAVSRKVDPNAVGRNRIKRALREQFRSLRAQLRPGAYVVVARAASADATAAALREGFVAVLARAGALPPPAADGTMPGASSSSTPSHVPTPDRCGE